MPADELVPVGRVGRKHGLDGAFVVERASADERRLAVGAVLLVDGEPAKVVARRRVGGGRVAIRLDRPAARGAELAVRRDDLPELDPGHYYAFQLAGLEVVDRDGGALGRVEDVLPAPANDNLLLDTGELVPLVEDAVLEIDLAAGCIVVDRGFLGLR